MNSLIYHSGPLQPTPEQRLLLMDDTQWEAFIEQCARQLMAEGQYAHVIRLGGAGDKGRDVCGYTLLPPIEGTWDLYQGKHYAGTLSPSNFACELAKFLWCVFSKQYTCPRNYFICALRVGPSLYDYVLNPDKLKKWILSEWKDKSGNFGTFKQTLTQSLQIYIQGFEFGIVKVKTPSDLLEIHSRSDKYWQMFGILPVREPNPAMPVTPDPEENPYVRALLEVYQEVAQITVSDLDQIPTKYKKHFKSQRMLFYSAEGLNRFSRDKLPGAFDELVNQVEVGIGSDLSFPHPDGLTRLTKVLDTASGLQVSANPLHARLQAGDLGGTCHHIVNQGRAKWLEDDE